MTKILLGSIVESQSPAGVIDVHNLINIVFTGFIACLPAFLNSFTVQIQALDWGHYGFLLPVILVLIKTITESMANGQ